MTDWNLDWLRNFAAKWLEYDSTEPDQAYGGTAADPWKNIDAWINEAYTDIINTARPEVPYENFKVTHTFTWPQGQVTLTLPMEVAYSQSLQMRDVTHLATGIEVMVYESQRAGGMYWKDRITLHWGNTQGPGEDKTYEWDYLADAEDLVDPLQSPILIPWRFRFLLGMHAVVLAREEVDEDNIPQAWRARRDKYLEDYLLSLAQGRLRFTLPPRIRPSISESSGVYV